MSHDSRYTWQPEPLVVIDHAIDLFSCPTEWPAYCQVSPTQWLFVGGIDPDSTLTNMIAEGTKIVMMLNTETHRLTRLTDIPAVMCAHSMMYLPPQVPTSDNQGEVFVFGGMMSQRAFQPLNFKYDVAYDEWTQIRDWSHGNYRLSFNLLPIVANRIIMVVSGSRPIMYDTEEDEFIRLHCSELSELGLV